MSQTKIANGSIMPCLTVSSLEETKKLFVDLLGLDLKEQTDEFRWMELATSDGSRLGFGEPWGTEGENKPGSNAIVSISVANVEESKAFLKSKGVEFLGETIEVPGEVKMALFRDKDGNQYFITERLK